jgi:hypothetical protein
MSNKYTRSIVGTRDIVVDGVTQQEIIAIDVDVYAVLDAFKVTNPAVVHAVKKLLAPGQRGHKDHITDLREAGLSITRAVEMEHAASGLMLDKWWRRQLKQIAKACKLTEPRWIDPRK